MALRVNNLGEDGTGRFPYGEFDVTHNGEDYLVRLTAIPPYREADDRLHCHIDWRRASDGRARRYENVVLPAKEAGDNGRRRRVLRRVFRQRRGDGTSIPSPVGDWP